MQHHADRLYTWYWESGTDASLSTSKRHCRSTAPPILLAAMQTGVDRFKQLAEDKEKLMGAIAQRCQEHDAALEVREGNVTRP